MIKNLKIEDIIDDKSSKFKETYKNEYESLKEDIIKNGLVTPLLVRVEGKKYKLLDGSIRLNIYKEMGRKTIPCYIRL